MAKRLSAKMAAWINENAGKHLCRCGCGRPIPIHVGHFTYGVAQFLRGHNLNAPKTPEEKFWAHVVKSDGCWRWAGSLATAGYGRINLGGGVRVLAHRHSYELHFGELPDGLFVCHRCDNRACVNPAHLFLGTCADNNADAAAKGRLRGQPGEANCRAKLTPDDVRRIRQRKAGGERAADLAQEYGVTPAAVYHLVRRLTWGHV